MFMETLARERSMVSEQMKKSAARDSATMKMKEHEGSSSCDIRAERCERKTENDDRNNDRNKFKKVEMSMFNGEDPDSW